MLQVARFIAAIVVHPMWTSGGIVTTALSLAGMQGGVLIFAVMLWRNTSRAEPLVPASVAEPRPLEATVEAGPPAAESKDVVDGRVVAV